MEVSKTEVLLVYESILWVPPCGRFERGFGVNRIQKNIKLTNADNKRTEFTGTFKLKCGLERVISIVFQN